MKWDRIVFLLIGLACGFGAGYMVSDYQFRRMENRMIATSASVQNPHQQNAMDEVAQKIKILKQKLQGNPKDVQALIALGNMYYDAGKFDEALTYYQDAYKLNVRDPNLITDMGTCYREMGDPNKALELYEEAVKKEPSHWQALYNAVIVCLHDLKDRAKAKTYFEKLKKVAPSDLDLKPIENALKP